MSLPLPNPENAAPLPVSVEPVPVPGQDQGQSTPNPAPAVAALPAVAVAPPATDAPPAEATAGRGETALAELHLAAQTTATTPASASASASAPAPARLATESHAAADQNKKRSKGPPSGSASTSAPAPAPLVKRSSGPSLLTQALASARGIFTSGSDKPVEAPLASPRLKSHTYDLATGSHPKQDPDQPSDTQPLDTNHDLNYESDGNSLTPRGSPRPATAMTPTATVSTTAVLSSSTRESFGSHTLNNTLDLGDVNSVLNGHRHFLRSRVRGTSLERTEKERRVSVGRAYSETSAPLAVTSPAITDQARDDAEIKAQVRPRKPENMLSLGPEKIWSIGSEDLNSGQDGQVEKSITEVLAGVEPNARSRKASHSLRFFKEGLPEEKLKRRESRLGPNPRGTLSPPSEINTAKDGGQARESTRSLLPSPALPDDLPGRLTRVRTFPMQSPATPTINESPDDYFDVPRMEKGTIELEKDQTRPPTERPEAEGPSSSSNGSPCAVKNVREEHRESSDKVEGGEHVEDGEDSGEEKISSAVFLPHQGLEQSSEHSQDSEEDLHIPKSGRTQSRAEGFHPWLVKADEPEPETVENPAKEQLREIESKSLEGLPPTEPSPQLFGEQNVSDERDFAIPSTPKSSHLAAQHYEEHVHDHQLAPKQPLDAIELIPYKHQVGGHTTIWRFSRRAVCKQLNNRENEFYETVERYHRDLLAFLPRYIGVLNVTFHKRPRRRSTVRRDDGATSERKQIDQKEPSTALQSNGAPGQVETVHKPDEAAKNESAHTRVISQSLQSSQIPVPTVTFMDNQHILPRSLLQPASNSTSFLGRFRSSSIPAISPPSNEIDGDYASTDTTQSRPTLEDRHANSWGATMVNKRLRNEVFNDAFLKQPIAIQRHKKAHQRTIPPKTLDRILRPASSDSSLLKPVRSAEPAPDTPHLEGQPIPTRIHQKSQSDLGPPALPREEEGEEPKDVTGTSAPEPQMLTEKLTPTRRKRRHSGSALRRKPKTVSEPRGHLQYWEEPDEVGYKGDQEDTILPEAALDASDEANGHGLNGSTDTGDLDQAMVVPTSLSAATTVPTSPSGELRIPRPVNPKEAQTQRDSRVEYFLLLEDLTAGMKRPCIMDLKMGTRQYGVEANEKKQKSQQRKCAATTSRELGVRVCGLQVWDANTQTYVFKDKYYGRDIKAGDEFQDALTRFLYDGVDPASILRHIPTVLQKLSQLEIIIQRLRGYRFYAASLLMFYDGDSFGQDNYDTAIEDSTTDFATDTEEQPVRKRKNKRDIDFKMADFANSVTAGDLAMMNKPCPPQHPNEPDRGFLRGLRSLRKYFLKIQQDTRAEMGLVASQRNSLCDPQMDISDDEGDVSV